MHEQRQYIASYSLVRVYVSEFEKRGRYIAIVINSVYLKEEYILDECDKL